MILSRWNLELFTQKKRSISASAWVWQIVFPLDQNVGSWVSSDNPDARGSDSGRIKGVAIFARALGDVHGFICLM